MVRRWYWAFVLNYTGWVRRGALQPERSASGSVDLVQMPEFWSRKVEPTNRLLSWFS